MRNYAFTLLLILGLTTVLSKPCNSHGPNTAPVLDMEAKVISEVKNGKAWLMKEGDNLLYIMKVSGSAYEMGYAQG